MNPIPQDDFSDLEGLQKKSNPSNHSGDPETSSGGRTVGSGGRAMNNQSQNQNHAEQNNNQVRQRKYFVKGAPESHNNAQKPQQNNPQRPQNQAPQQPKNPNTQAPRPVGSAQPKAQTQNVQSRPVMPKQTQPSTRPQLPKSPSAALPARPQMPKPVAQAPQKQAPIAPEVQNAKNFVSRPSNQNNNFKIRKKDPNSNNELRVRPLSPGDSFVDIPKWKNKKMFPFLTPQQALKKAFHQLEHRPGPIAPSTLRIIPFGGLEQVGLNCIGFEYEDELLIVDMGIQFADQYQHGINGSVPDLSYAKHKKIVGVAITHGHIDHIGGIPFVMRTLGKGTPMYATPMAHDLIKMRQAESDFQLTNLHVYHRDKIVEMGKHFRVMPFTVDHSIPDSVGLLIYTPVGRFVHTGDWKFDKNPLPNRPSVNYDLLKNIGDAGVRCLLSDSTNAHLPGSSISESEVIGSIEEIFEKAPGRIITATFSSIIDRVMVIIAASEKFGRKVVLLGRGMNNYMDIAIKLGYARPKPGTLITMKEANELPDNEVTICCTGAQGERYAALMRIATGESKDTNLKKDDVVVFSSSVIPGNERNVQGLFDVISAQGPRIYQYKESEIHAGGHARQEDTQKMIGLIRPEVYMPIYGYPHMIMGNAKNAAACGYGPSKVIIGKNGQVIEFTKDSFSITPYFVPHRLMSVDGYTVGMSKEEHMHDRYQMQVSGAMTVSIAKKGTQYLIRTEKAGLPDFSNFPKLEPRINDFLEQTLRGDLSRFKDVDAFKAHLGRKVSDIVHEEIGKEPIVMVVLH